MNLRGCAAQILAMVIGDGQSLTAALDHGLPKLKDTKDRAFVQALCYGVVRHYYALDFALSKLLGKPLKAKDGDIKALLLVGLYQLQHMRVKAHAAVSETVAATSHKPWLGAWSTACCASICARRKACCKPQSKTRRPGSTIRSG